MLALVNLRRWIFQNTHKSVLTAFRCLSQNASVQTPALTKIIPPVDLDEANVDWDEELKGFKTPQVFDRCDEDVSDLKPFLSPTYNAAAYINKSETLQELLKLGVDFHSIEQKPKKLEVVLRLDFEKDIRKCLMFLNDYVSSDKLGEFITKNPFIFKEDLDDLQVRINYLESKKFSIDMIKRILTLNPFWLNFSTHRIDRKLGYFQHTFKLTGDEVRLLVTRQPKVVTYKMALVTLNTFTIKEEWEFEDDMIRNIVLARPYILMLAKDVLNKRLQYIMHTMNVSHKTITDVPGILFCREYKLKQRHEFLVKLGRAQYDPKKENYVPLYKVYEGNDQEFCDNIAKCTIQDYNLYLKTL